MQCLTWHRSEEMVGEMGGIFKALRCSPALGCGILAQKLKSRLSRKQICGIALPFLLVEIVLLHKLGFVLQTFGSGVPLSALLCF